MDLPHIMKAGLDDLIPVVIIITVVISRIMKAAKQGKPLVPTPSDRTPPRRAPRAPLEPNTDQPADELREFLQALSGVQQEKPEPPLRVQRPAAQARPQPPPPPRVRAAKRARSVQAATPAPTPAPPRPRKPRSVSNQPERIARPVSVEACELKPAREELNKHLRNAGSLRGAWVLREVLGPPLGLRS